MDCETIRYVVQDGVARIMLNRPDRLNSFTAQMHEELATVLAQLPHANVTFVPYHLGTVTISDEEREAFHASRQPHH